MHMMGSITNVLLLIFFFIFFHSALAKLALVHSSSESRCIESEWEALMEFKASLFDKSNNLSSWTGHDCCSWDGITCHSLTGHVQSLELSDRNFNSTLSPWLFNLSHLEVLRMNFSGLIGPIPNMFEKLTTLTTLDLYANEFESAAFPDSLCNLKGLTYMDLGGNHLQGSLPSCVGNLTSLTKLNLCLNEFSGEIPGGLGNLTNLTSLDLSQNSFNSSIPFSLGNLQQLEYLFLYDNQLTGTIPSTLGKLTKLIQLDTSDNSLAGELSESVFEGLKSLDWMDISRNYHLVFNMSPQWIPPFQMSTIFMDSIIIGTQFPPWLQTQRNLNELVMKKTRISGAIPDWFLTASPALTEIDISDNLLTSFDCVCLTTFPNLIFFNISNNLLIGSIPDRCQTAFPNLQHIDLSNNFLTGSVPAFYSASLKYLLLSRNQFSGNIPQQLCNLTSLQFLSLDNNQLMGVIPLCLGALESLSVLNLGNNILSGHIPCELGSFKNLTSLHLNGNRFSGELPGSWQYMRSLTTHDLGKNQLCGPIPHWIGQEYMPLLQFLRLESNKFSGEISVNLCQLHYLQILNLAVNNLVGIIPPCIGNLSNMQLDESGLGSIHYPNFNEVLLNIIKGIEREYFSSLQYAKFISLSSNHLYGEIPDEIMNLNGLQSLNLSNNELTGMIPERIDNMKHLESLDLSMNRLSGTIPQSLAEIDSLGYLNLSCNNLAGRIPSGNHFDTLNDPSIYQGNVGLCGKLLMKSCPGDALESRNQPSGPVSDAGADDEFELMWLYAGIGPGFAVGLLGVIFVLYFKDEWRIAFFGFADNVCNRVRLMFAIKISQFCVMFNQDH